MPGRFRIALVAAIIVVMGSVLLQYHAGPIELVALAAVGAIALVLIIGGMR